MKIEVASERDMRDFGAKLGGVFEGGEIIELVGDVGAGKTTLTKGLAEGLDIAEPVQSPTFTISRIYPARDDLELRHYDFYRLNEAGVMAEELSEAVNSPASIVVVEWASAVAAVLPEDRLQIEILATGEKDRRLEVRPLGNKSKNILEKLS